MKKLSELTLTELLALNSNSEILVPYDAVRAKRELESRLRQIDFNNTEPFISKDNIQISDDEENERLKKEVKATKKDLSQTKDYITQMKKEALEKHGKNFELLVFIQRLEEAFTWIKSI